MLSAWRQAKIQNTLCLGGEGLRNTTARPAGLFLFILLSLLLSGCPSENQPAVSLVPLRIYALDSVNGSLLSPGFVISVKGASGTSAQYTGGGNPFDIMVEPNDTYEIVVNSSGRAEDRHDSIVVGTSAISDNYICEELGNTSFAVESPKISSFTYTTDSDPTASNASYSEILNSASIDLAAVTGIKVISTSKAPVCYSSYGGGIWIALDRKATQWNHISTASNSSVYDASSGYYTNTALFEPGFGSVVSGSHYISLVAYDRTNNRAERTVYITDPSAYTGGADISGDHFSNLASTLSLYGTSASNFSADGIKGISSSLSASYRSLISFSFIDDSGSAVKLLGFKVYRSEDGGSTYSLVGRTNYSNSGSSGTHSYYDYDSKLELGKSYMYRVTAFTDDVHENTSSPTPAVAFLAPFTASLVSPADGADGFDPSSGNFTYTISDVSNWSSGKCDSYYFAPLIRNINGSIAYYGEFIYLMSTGDLRYRRGSSYLSVSTLGKSVSDCFAIDTASGTITLKPALFSAGANLATGNAAIYYSGQSYCWDVFGYQFASGETGSVYTMRPQQFVKTVADSTNGTNAYSYSFAESPLSGNNTLNGSFTFEAK